MLTCLLSSPGKEALGTEDDYADHSSNACSSSFLLPRGFLEIPPQTLCNQSVKATTCLALIAHLNFSRRLHVFTIDLQYCVANWLAAETLQNLTVILMWPTHCFGSMPQKGMEGDRAVFPFTGGLWGYRQTTWFRSLCCRCQGST